MNTLEGEAHPDLAEQIQEALKAEGIALSNHTLHIIQRVLDDNEVNTLPVEDKNNLGDLKEIRSAFQWTWDNMGMPHTADHFNIPANGLQLLDNFIAGYRAKEAALQKDNKNSDNDYEPYFGWCDVKGCENEGCMGGGVWADTGYWTVCSKHSDDYRKGKPKPKMKETAIKRESSRDEKGYLTNYKGVMTSKK